MHKVNFILRSVSCMSRFSYNSPQKNCLGHYQLGKYTVIIPVGLFVVNFIKGFLIVLDLPLWNHTMLVRTVRAQTKDFGGTIVTVIDDFQIPLVW